MQNFVWLLSFVIFNSLVLCRFWLPIMKKYDIFPMSSHAQSSSVQKLAVVKAVALLQCARGREVALWCMVFYEDELGL